MMEERESREMEVKEGVECWWRSVVHRNGVVEGRIEEGSRGNSKNGVMKVGEVEGGE